MAKHFLSALFSVALPLAAAFADEPDKVKLDIFFSPGCTECERVKKEVFPELESQFEGFYDLAWHDMTQSDTIPLLVAYQERCKSTENGRVSMVVDHTAFLSGYETISTGLFDRVNEALLQRQAPGWKLADPPALQDKQSSTAVVRERAKAMTVSVVAAGGLLDGFNPCAISTLIFFMSVLTVAKATRRTRLLVGVSFIGASFVVYMALGLGFLFALRQTPNFPVVKKVIEIALGLCMIPLAVLSFRDAFRFRKTQRPDDVTLQIPKKIKDRIHSFMNSRLGVGGPIIGGLVTGAGVTILESVCTGQSYVPVLTYMVQEGLAQEGMVQESARWSYWVLLLVIYNLLFVLPLAVVFFTFHRGMQLKSLISWSRNNLVVVKILLGIFFTAMAILLLWHYAHPKLGL